MSGIAQTPGDRPAADARVPCRICGHALEPGHGNRRYHPGECARQARRESGRRAQAAYRARLQPPGFPQVPPDLNVSRIDIRGVLMPGEDSAAIVRAAMPVLLQALAFNEALKRVPWSDVITTPELTRIRTFVDDVITFVEALNEHLPIAEISSNLIDPARGLNTVDPEDVAVTLAKLRNQRRRAGAPSRQN